MNSWGDRGHGCRWDARARASYCAYLEERRRAPIKVNKSIPTHFLNRFNRRWPDRLALTEQSRRNHQSRTHTHTQTCPTPCPESNHLRMDSAIPNTFRQHSTPRINLVFIGQRHHVWRRKKALANSETKIIQLSRTLNASAPIHVLRKSVWNTYDTTNAL